MISANQKTYCFIDYENVHESGFEGVETLSDGDSVTIFISSVSHKISLVVLETLIRKKCELNIIHTIGTGKNNLDFQLIAEVGYQIGIHQGENFLFSIISKDRGYENVVTAFLNRGVKILQCETIEKIGHSAAKDSFIEVETENASEWAYAALIRESLDSLKLPAVDLKKIETIFRESSTLAVLHDKLAKSFGKKGNHPLYSKLKTLHKKYQKTLPPMELPQAQDDSPSQNPDLLLYDPGEFFTEVGIDADEVTEFFSDQMPDSVEAVMMGVEDGFSDHKDDAERENSSDAPAEKPVKRKPRGRKKKPAAGIDETQSLVEVTLEPVLPVQEIETDSVTEPKKKRRPGRPRKKNHSAPADASGDRSDSETATVKQELNHQELE